MAQGRRVGVMGLGNVLMRDDALGPYVIGLLQARYRFEEGVSVEDLGTPGLDLHPHLAGLDALILVDTVRADGDPGEVRTYRRDEILRHAPAQRLGPHDPGVKEALLALEFAGDGPSDVFLVGVIPGNVEQSVGLTAEVQDAVPAVVDQVLAELERLGYTPAAYDPPREPDLWWERPATPVC
jgi:hydrogenase maturation protease